MYIDAIRSLVTPFLGGNSFVEPALPEIKPAEPTVTQPQDAGGNVYRLGSIMRHLTTDVTFDDRFTITSDTGGLVRLRFYDHASLGTGVWVGVTRDEVDCVIDALTAARDRAWPIQQAE